MLESPVANKPHMIISILHTNRAEFLLIGGKVKEALSHLEAAKVATTNIKKDYFNLVNSDPNLTLGWYNIYWP